MRNNIVFVVLAVDVVVVFVISSTKIAGQTYVISNR